MVLRVAVVDDEPQTAQLVSRVLTARGHEVRTFLSALECLEFLRRERMDVVVTDFIMPGMKGDELCEELHRRQGVSSPPVIILSAGTGEQHVGRALDVGARFYIRKPFAVGELVAMVERAARKPAPFPDEDIPLPERIGRFRITGRLGRGGMGVVYRGKRDGTGEDVAIKVLPLASASVDDQLRFRREFDILGALDHPGVARVVETGIDQQYVFYAMEFVPGRSLWAEIHSHGALSWGRVARVGRTVAVALAYVHARGVVHRDIKPTNIILLPDDSAKLVDFGMARRPADQALTAQQVVPGTPLYLAPEAARGLSTTPPGDVFALGLTLHFALAGKHPMADAAQDLMRLFTTYANGQIPPVGQAVPELPVAMEDLVREMTHPDAAVRPSAMEVGRRLGALVQRPALAPLP